MFFNAGVVCFLLLTILLQSLKLDSEATAQKADLTASWNALQQRQWHPQRGDFTIVPQNSVPSTEDLEGSEVTPSDSTYHNGFFTRPEGIWREWRLLQISELESVWGMIEYNSSHLQNLRSLLRVEVAFREKQEYQTDIGTYLKIPLTSVEGDLIGWVDLKPFDYAQPKSAGALFHLTAVALILVTLTITLLAYVWFVHPISKLLKALESEKADELESNQSLTGEMKQLTQLISQSMRQKERLRKEIERRDVAETALKKREIQLTRLIEERERLNRDLHDEIIQSLFALGLRMESARTDSENSQASSDWNPVLFSCRDQVNEVIRKLRHYLESPGQFVRVSESLKEQIEEIIASFGENNRFTIRVEIPDALEEVLTAGLRHEILALISEGVSNSIRHGQPNVIKIHARLENNNDLHLEITDDGKGCEKRQMCGGRGLLNMRNRILDLKGHLNLDSQPNCGFQIRAVIPLKKPL